jgi:hypothetical protein
MVVCKVSEVVEVVLVLMKDKTGSTSGEMEAPGSIGNCAGIELPAGLESGWRWVVLFDSNVGIRMQLRPYPGLIG